MIDLGNAAKEIEDALEGSGLKDHCKSDFNLLKAHETGQLPFYITLFEEAIAMSAEAGENSHKETVSKNYGHTNKVFPLRDMTRYHQVKTQARYIESLNLQDADPDDNDGEDNHAHASGSDSDADVNVNDGNNNGGEESDNDDGEIPAEQLPAGEGKAFKLTSRSMQEFRFGQIPVALLQERPPLAALNQAIMIYLNNLNAQQPPVLEADLAEVKVPSMSSAFPPFPAQLKTKTNRFP